MRTVNSSLFYISNNKIPKAVAKGLDNDEAQMHKMVEVSISFAKFGAKEDAVKWEISLFPSERTKAFLCSCIVEKLTQVLGLPNDSAQASPLIFNDKTASSSSSNTTAGS